MSLIGLSLVSLILITAAATEEKIAYSSTFQLQKLFQVQLKLNRIGPDNGYCNSNWTHLDSRFVAEHPVAAYGFIKCLNQQTEMLHETDLKGAALSLVRLQDVYNFEITDILRGKVYNYESNITLSVDDCIFIAKQAFFNLQLDAADRWLHHCNVHQMDNSHPDMDQLSQRSNWINELRYYISSIRDIMSTNDSGSNEILRIVLKSFPDFSRAALTILTEKKEILKMKSTLSFNANLLCLGLRPPWVTDKNLNCFLIRQNLFSYYPTLVEKVHHQPEILIFHQIINRVEIQSLKLAASPKLEMSKTHRYGDGKSEITSARIGQMAWISPKTNQLVQNIYQRMEKITGLRTESAEEFQVLNYGLGGHYEIHMDFFDFNRKGTSSPTGDRIATALFYLNDVKSGGSTVFPELGIQVHPTKGSALMWRNLLPDGSGDYRTIHAACPVITGTKWVANLWFHENGQQTPASS